LTDANTPSITRRALVGRAAAGAAALGTLGAFGPIPAAFASTGGDSISARIDTAVTADFTLVTHTDQGSQLGLRRLHQVIDDHRVLASVGSVGDAYDNAMAAAGSQCL
jgi:hypothetical protein